jgi:hypothetical protein
MIAKTRTPAGVTLLAKVNLVIYVLLLFWALSLVLYAANVIALGIVLYSIAGVVCSLGLLQSKRWSFYMAMAMWMSEGTVSSWITYSNMELFSKDPETIIMFLSIAIFKFATAAYLAKKSQSTLSNKRQVVLPQATTK